MSVRSYCGPPNPCINILGSLRDTTVDGGLYLYETNNNNVIKEQKPSFFGNFFGTGTLRRSSYFSSSVHDPITDRSMLISTLLNDKEKRAVLEYVGNESSLLATGVCELLEESNGSWINPQRGIVCLIKEKTNKTYSISLLQPSSTKVVWFRKISRSFQTTKDHDHLVTFEIASTTTDDDFCIFGLNFYDTKEAQNFHTSVADQYASYCLRKSSEPIRLAPARPMEQSSKPIVLADDTLGAHIVDSEEQLQLPQKKKKKSIFGYFKKKNKDKKAKQEKLKLTGHDISKPMDFTHFDGADFTVEQREAVEILSKNIKFDLNNAEQRDFIRQLATEHHSAIRASIREKPNESFQRGTSGLEGTRSSIMLHKTTKGCTPRERKRTSGNKKNETILEEKEQSSSADEDKNSHEEDNRPIDPLHPDWERNESAVIPSFSPQPPSQTTHSTGSNTHRYSNNNNDYVYATKNDIANLMPLSTPVRAPQAPVRTASRLVRQNTPPHPSALEGLDPARPRLPDKDEPIPSRLSYHFTRRVSKSPPSSPPPPLMSPTRPPPPVFNKAGSPLSSPLPPPPEMKFSAQSTSPSSISPPPPPPPLPPSLLVPPVLAPSAPKAPPPPPLVGINLAPKSSSATTSPSLSPGPPVSPDRRSFLDEIQNVDKSKLLRSTSTQNPSLVQKQSNEMDGGIMSSIQRMMDSIRPQLEDSDSDSDDSSSTDSYWSD